MLTSWLGARRRAKAEAEFMALAGVVKFILDAMPPDQRDLVKSRLTRLIGDKMLDLPVPSDVPRGQEQAYRDRFSQIAQVMVQDFSKERE